MNARRAVITGEQFERLLAGESLKFTAGADEQLVEIRLADIGFAMMARMLAQKARESGVEIAALLEAIEGLGERGSGELQFIAASCSTRVGQRQQSDATLVACDCGSPFFRAFTVQLGDGGGHSHLQCAACGVSYCQEGQCE